MEPEGLETSITYRDVLLTLAMEQIQSGEPVDVIATLTALGMTDVVEAARIAQEVEDEEDDEELPDDPDADEIADAESETANDSELE
jgi:hypothetical protein